MSKRFFGVFLAFLIFFNDLSLVAAGCLNRHSDSAAAVILRDKAEDGNQYMLYFVSAETQEAYDAVYCTRTVYRIMEQGREYYGLDVVKSVFFDKAYLRGISVEK